MEFKKDKNGYLIVPAKIARVGTLEYAAHELGMRGDEVVEVYRDKDELFSDETIKSFEGMPITLLHPDDSDVSAEDWKEKAAGHVQNVRAEADWLVCDAYVQDGAAIKVIEDKGIIELSCGYDAEIKKVGDKLIQYGIVGNHIAIVPEGRCGSTCRLGDSKEVIMKTTVKFGDSLRKIIDKAKAIKINDDAAEEADKKTKELAEQIQEVIEQLTQVAETADEAEDAAAKAAEEKDKQPVGDADPEAEAKIAELEARVAELEEENAKLKEEIEKLKGEEETRVAVGDAATHFPAVKLGDCKTARDVKVKVLANKTAIADSALTRMSNEEINAAYAAVVATKAPRTSNIGKTLLGDSKTKPVAINTVFGRKGEK